MLIRALIVGFGAVICVTTAACTPPVSGLFEAATVGDRGAAKSSLKKGADINATPTGSSWTPLHVAAEYGHDKMIVLLIKYGADVNARDSKGNTPLHLAAYEGSEATCRCLLDGGADLYARNNVGETPLQLAEGHVDTERIMQDYLARDSN